MAESLLVSIRLVAAAISKCVFCLGVPPQHLTQATHLAQYVTDPSSVSGK